MYKFINYIILSFNEITTGDHKKYILFLQNQINIKKFIRIKLIFFKF